MGRRSQVLVSIFAVSIASHLADAQTLNGDRLRLTTGPCTISSQAGSPGSVILGPCPAISTPAATDLTLKPTGDLVLGPTGADVLPDVGYSRNLGALNRKYLTLHAAELWVETLVAQNTIATIGGRVLVAPTTALTADIAPAATSIVVKHNNLANGDRVYLEANGSVEWLAVTSSASGAGPYTYSVTRNLDGSGANQWYAGDAVLNTGTTGNGFIDLYSVAGVLSGAGPTIVGNVRTGTTYNQVAPRWAIGNINGLFNYGATTYGVAFGDAAATNVTVDATNGFRIRSGTTNKLVADTSGNLSMTGDLSVGAAGVVRSNTATGFTTGDGFWLEGGSTPKFRIGNPSGNRLSYDASTGALTLYGDGNGLTNIGPGSITVGAGRNMIRNSDCAASTTDWTSGTTSGNQVTFSFGLAGFRLNDQLNTCYVALSVTPTAGTLTFAVTSTGNEYPVRVGARYEASAYLGVVRSGNSYISIQWFNSGGTYLSQNDGSVCTAASSGGLTLASFCRSGILATAPTNATTAKVVVYTTHTAENNPFLFWVHSYFGEATSGQTEFTPWGPAGVTEIIGGMIRAASITVDKLSVASLSAISANLGTVTAGTLTGVTATFGGAVTLDSNGITLTAGTANVNKVKWSGGSTVYEFSGSLNLTAAGDINLLPGGSGSINFNRALIPSSGDNVGASGARVGTVYTDALNLGSGTVTKSGWAGGSNRAVCVDTAGALYAATGSTCP